MKAGEEKLAPGPAGEAGKPSRLVQHVREAFSPHGLLTQKLPSFVPRESQREFVYFSTEPSANGRCTCTLPLP